MDAAAVERLTGLIRELEPHVVFTHAALDPFNPDHGVAHDATVQARQLASGAGVASAFTTIAPPELLLFEPHQPELCGFVPTTFLDITPVWEQEGGSDGRDGRAGLSQAVLLGAGRAPRQPRPPHLGAHATSATPRRSSARSRRRRRPVSDYAAFARLGAATVHEAAGRTGVVDFPLIQIVPGSRVAGPARIALCAPRDNTMVHALIAHADPGDVLVLTSADPVPVAFVGELLATQAQQRGVAGLLVDGAVRDLDELAAIGLPIWARFVRAQGATKGEAGSSTCRSWWAAPTCGRATSSSWTATARWCSRRARMDEVLPLALERERARARHARALRGGRALVRPAGPPRARRGKLMEVAVLGLGEAGEQDRRRPRAAGCTVRGWDPAQRPAGIANAASDREAVAGADVVLSLNDSGPTRSPSAPRVAGALAADALYADLNTPRPSSSASLRRRSRCRSRTSR